MNDLATEAIKQFKASTGNPFVFPEEVSLSLNFFFSDDLLLIAEASCDQANGIKKVLNTFCKSSGKKVSSQKTKVFFSKNVQQLEMKKIGEMFGFSVTNDLGNFIRMPISLIE